MAMKQTQTKLFDFSDVGLDFCAGSKNLFPDRFKKMLSLGYNVQTVASVAVVGNQVTLTYGGTHGYVADRVLKVDSSALAAINGGEFWIDSVTTNTVTFTLDDAPFSITGGFTTRIASLGWDLVYENAHIHIYKFKHIDDTDMYARLCFQNATVAGNRNCILVGIGRNFDANTGFIVEPNNFAELKESATVAGSVVKWDFTYSTASTFNNYTYQQGYSTFGNASVVGSLYHIVISHNQAASSIGGYSTLSGIVPFHSHYEKLNLPILIAQNNGASNTTTTNGQLPRYLAYVGTTRVDFQSASSANPSNTFANNIAVASYLPTSIDTFNTTCCTPLSVFTSVEKQFIGMISGGLYQACYSNAANSPSLAQNSSPSITYDIDHNNICVTHGSISASSTVSVYFVVPVEEVKIGA